MRSVAILFAISLVAACPPRRGRVVYVQPSACPAPVVVGCAVTPPPAKIEKVTPPVDPAVGIHLKAWEEKAAELTNFRTEIALARTDATLKKTTSYAGLALLMKPNYAALRLNNTADKTGADYDSLLCNGKAVYVYNGVAKTVIEFKMPVRLAWPVQGGAEHLRFGFDLLTGVKASELHERFEITLLKVDENYVYLDLKPRTDKDRANFRHVRLALYGPGASTTKMSYLPAQIYVLKPNGDTEQWKFTNPQMNIPGVEAKHFQYVEIKGWKVQKIGANEPPAPAKP